MEHPFDMELLLPLEVNAKIGDNWYDCKWSKKFAKFNFYVL